MKALEACMGISQASPAAKDFVTFNRLADRAVDNKLFTLSGSKASFAPFNVLFQVSILLHLRLHNVFYVVFVAAMHF